MAWVRNHRDELPPEPLKQRDVFFHIQESASVMMMAYAQEHKKPFEERAAKIKAFAEKYHGLRHIDQNRDRALDLSRYSAQIVNAVITGVSSDG
jgi:hypothetical protein